MTTQKRARWRCVRLLLLATLVSSCAALRPRTGSHVETRDPVEIHGRVVCRSTGEPLDSGAPLVVFARPLSDTSPAPIETTPMLRVDGMFSPSFLVVPAGGRVRFENGEKICHSFFSSSAPNVFNLGLLKPGTSAACRFERPGLVHVYCALHARKQATILVTPTRHFAIVGPTGAFKIGNLAPGAYVLETWGEGLPPQRMDVTVGVDETTVVEIPVDDPPAGWSG